MGWTRLHVGLPGDSKESECVRTLPRGRQRIYRSFATRTISAASGDVLDVRTEWHRTPMIRCSVSINAACVTRILLKSRQWKRRRRR